MMQDRWIIDTIILKLGEPVFFIQTLLSWTSVEFDDEISGYGWTTFILCDMPDYHNVRIASFIDSVSINTGPDK
jgi:hypothetical protein